MVALTGAYDTGLFLPNDGLPSRGAWFNIPWETTEIASIQLIISGTSTSGILRHYNIYDGTFEDEPFTGSFSLRLVDEDQERTLFWANFNPGEGSFTDTVANLVPYSWGEVPDFTQLFGVNVLAVLDFLPAFGIESEPIADALATATSLQLVITSGGTTVTKSWGDYKAQFK